MEKGKDMDQEMSSLIQSVYGEDEKPAPSDDKAETARWSVSGSENFQSFQTDSAVEAMEGFKSDIKGKVVDNRNGEVAAEVTQEGDKAPPAWQAGQDLQTAYDKEKDAYEMGRVGDEITPDIENDKEKLTAYAHGAQASYSEAVDYLSRAQNDPEFKSVMEQRDWDHAELESNAASAQEAVVEAQQRLDAMERDQAENEDWSVSLDKEAIQQAQTEADVKDWVNNRRTPTSELVDVPAATESATGKEEKRPVNPVPVAESDDVKRSKIPPELEGKYSENGDRLLDRQGKARFEVTDDNIKSLEKDPRDAADMVAVADHNGWEAIKLKGDKEFRREAWIEATARGMQVKGYSPEKGDLDRVAARESELAAKRGAERDQGKGDTAETSHAASETPNATTPPVTDDKPSGNLSDSQRKAMRDGRPADIAKKHPDLEKAASVVAAAEVFAKEKIGKDEDREQFTSSVREMLIDRLDKGQSIQGVDRREYQQPQPVAAKEMAEER